MGLAGLSSLGFSSPLRAKDVLILVETDGCFLDGLSAATGCTPGHRTLRIEDYGKIAATFVDICTNKAIRISPVVDLRVRANALSANELKPFQAQMWAYRVMPIRDIFNFTSVSLRTPVQTILSRPKVRYACDSCNEEIINEREIPLNGSRICKACAGNAYYVNC